MHLVPALTIGPPRQPATPPPVWVAVPHWDEVPTELQMFLLRSRHPELSYAERLLKCNYIPGRVTRKTTDTSGQLDPATKSQLARTLFERLFEPARTLVLSDAVICVWVVVFAFSLACLDLFY